MRRDSALGYFFLPFPDRLRAFSNTPFSPGLPLVAAERKRPAGVRSASHLAWSRLPHVLFVLASPGFMGGTGEHLLVNALASL